MSKNNKFNISIDLEDVGVTRYEINQTDTKENGDVELDKEPIIATITSKYVLSKNQVVSTYKLSSNGFNNKMKDESIIKNVPDTFKGRGIIGLIIGIICIISGTIVCFPIYKKRKANIG